MKYSDTEQPLLGERLKYITDRWTQLNHLTKDISDRAIAYLTLTNAGGAVAMLSFLGANRDLRDLLPPKLALGSFVLGIVFVGVLHARMFHHVENIFANWRKAVRIYYDDQIDWEDMTATDDNLSYNTRLEYLAGYISFGCFIVGVVIGVCGLFYSWSKS